MAKNSSLAPGGVSGAGRPSRMARAFHLLEALSGAKVRVRGWEEQCARAALIGCAAIPLTAVSLFGIAEVPAPLRMAAPLIGLGLVLPWVLALWLGSISPRRARALAQLAAMALVAAGSAGFARAAAVPVVLGYLLPAFLLLYAGDELS